MLLRFSPDGESAGWRWFCGERAGSQSGVRAGCDRDVTSTLVPGPAQTGEFSEPPSPSSPKGLKHPRGGFVVGVGSREGWPRTFWVAAGCRWQRCCCSRGRAARIPSGASYGMESFPRRGRRRPVPTPGPGPPCFGVGVTAGAGEGPQAGHPSRVPPVPGPAGRGAVANIKAAIKPIL